MRKQLLCRLSESRQSPAHRASESACSIPLFPPWAKGRLEFEEKENHLPVGHNIHAKVRLPLHHPLDHGSHLDGIPPDDEFSSLQIYLLPAFPPLPHLPPFSSLVSTPFPFSCSTHTNMLLNLPPTLPSNVGKPNSPLAIAALVLFEPVPDGPLHPGPHHCALHHHPDLKQKISTY